MTQENSDEATVWTISDINRLRRFLFLGTEKGAYKISNTPLTKETASCVIQMINGGRGAEVVAEIIKCTTENEAAKQQPAIYALALCAKLPTDVKTKRQAFQALPVVCRTPSTLFQFVSYANSVSEKSGWGRAQRSALSAWYNDKEPRELALAVTKYRHRNGYSHLDLLRLAHIKPANPGTALILKYVSKGIEQLTDEGLSDELKEVLQYLKDTETVKHSHDEQQVARLVERHSLCWEHVPTWMRHSKEVWRALLPHIPLLALLKQLGKLTQLGIISAADEDSQLTSLVIERLKNEQQLRQARIQPCHLLVAKRAYERGSPEKVRRSQWTPHPAVVEALNTAYCASFSNLAPTNKSYLVVLDLQSLIGGCNGTPYVASALACSSVAMVIARLEENYAVVIHAKGVKTVPVTNTMSLQETQQAIKDTSIGHRAADPSWYLSWAGEQQRAVDVFVVFTDRESFETSPAQQLMKYRRVMNQPEARLVVCSLASDSLSVAHPDDAGMLDMVGFDGNTPLIIRKFALGEL